MYCNIITRNSSLCMGRYHEVAFGLVPCWCRVCSITVQALIFYFYFLSPSNCSSSCSFLLTFFPISWGRWWFLQRVHHTKKKLGVFGSNKETTFSLQLNYFTLYVGWYWMLWEVSGEEIVLPTPIPFPKMDGWIDWASSKLKVNRVTCASSHFPNWIIIIHLSFKSFKWWGTLPW